MEKLKIQKVAGAAAEGSGRCETGACFETVVKRATENVTENVTNDAIESVAESAGLAALSDKDLYALCKEYGGKARLWARKFAFLLPEVARRGLHRKYKCESIYEFSAKLAGMSREVTYRILSLAGRLKEMPKLWGMIRRHGWRKLMVVAGIAAPATENYWIEMLENMSRPTLELFIRELKKQEDLPNQVTNVSLFVPNDDVQNDDNALSKPGIGGAQNFWNENLDGKMSENSLEQLGENSLKNFPELQGTFRKLKFNVDAGTEISLKMFKQELEKARKEAITMGEALRALLEIAELAKMLSRCMPKEYRGLFPYWRA